MQTFQEFMASFPDETACRTYLTLRRWPAGPQCPLCGNTKVYESSSRPFTWQCRAKTDKHTNPYRFSVLVGTIFENTNVPVSTWFKVLYTMLQSKKGVSSRQIGRMFFGERSSTHTAWYVCHRLRAAMYDDDFRQLMGIVEIDETYIGGKQANRHAKDRAKFTGRGAHGTGKTTVIGAIARKGNVTCKIIDDASHHTINRFVKKAVSDKVDLVATDSAAAYSWLGLTRNHQMVRWSITRLASTFAAWFTPTTSNRSGRF